MKPITILHVIDTLQTGGTESQLVRTLPRLDPQAFRQVVCLLRDVSWPTWLATNGVETYPLGLSSKNSIIRGVWRLRRIIDRVRPDLLHTHLFEATLIGRLAGRWARLPVVTTLVNTPYAEQWRRDDPRLNRLKVELVRVVDAATASWTIQYIAISEVVRRFAVQDQRISPDRITVIHRGIAVDELPVFTAEQVQQVRQSLGYAPSDFLVLNVGRLVPQKGQQYLIAAMAQLRNVLPQARLAIAGEGRQRAALEAQIRARGLEGVARLLGDRRDVAALLAAADAFAFPSVSEGFGVALLEAMAFGTPCITSDLDIVREVAGTESVVLVPPRSADALADAVVALARDPERRRQLSAAAQRRARTFDLNGAARHLEEVYRRAVGPSGAPAPALVGGGRA